MDCIDCIEFFNFDMLFVKDQVLWNVFFLIHKSINHRCWFLQYFSTNVLLRGEKNIETAEINLAHNFHIFHMRQKQVSLVDIPLPAVGISEDNTRRWEIVRKMNSRPRRGSFKRTTDIKSDGKLWPDTGLRFCATWCFSSANERTRKLIGGSEISW